MIGSVLVICVGNICRSPTGERVLQATLPGLKVGSAGIAALVGKPADPVAAESAAEKGISLDGHVARQLTPELGARYDLILAMEPGHRAEIMRRFPTLSGRTLLFDQWSGAKGISDPYRHPIEYHREIRDRIIASAEAWVPRLKPKV